MSPNPVDSKIKPFHSKINSTRYGLGGLHTKYRSYSHLEWDNWPTFNLFLESRAVGLQRYPMDISNNELKKEQKEKEIRNRADPYYLASNQPNVL